MTTLPKISVVVPCFNEEMWVAKVIFSLLACPAVSEIIAVDDGSTDDTLKILKLFQDKIKIISYKKNRGKGAALAAGIEKARGEIVVFLDAHHLNVKDSHLRAMTAPLLKNKSDAVLGTTPTRLPDLFWRFTGFRAYKREDLLPFLPKIKRTKFGVELYLNEIFKRKKVKVIYPPGLIHLTKYQKMPISQIPNASLNQVVEMAQTLAEIKGVSPQRIKKILNPRGIKSFKTLKRAVEKLKDKQILKFLKDYILSYLKE